MNHGAAHHLWRGEAATSTAIHRWLREHYPKTGVCEDCCQPARTHYAFLYHPRRHTRDREDYRELCPSCHSTFDARPHTHCRRGHALTDDNVITHGNRRWCRTCKNVAALAAYHRRKRQAA
jgi:hypothetical protein